MSKSPTKAGSLPKRLPNRLTGDEELASRISGGDPAAFDEMFRRYHQAIYRFCSSMVGPEDAKDMLQNVMTKVMTSMPENEDFQMKPWLYRVARNECLDHLRSSRRTEPGLDAESRSDLSGRRDPHQVALGRERMTQLVEDLNSLPEKQRATLVMRELSGLAYPEIAQSMGTTEAGAKQLVYEARLSLQQVDLGRKLDCAEVRESISSMDRRRLRGRRIRSHMRSCSDCADFERAIADRKAGFRSLTPVLPVGAAAGILDVIREGGAAAGIAGAGVASGAAAGGISSGVVAKGMVAVLVAGSVGVGTAEVVRHQETSKTANGGRTSTGPAGIPADGPFAIPLGLETGETRRNGHPGSAGPGNKLPGRSPEASGQPGSRTKTELNPSSISDTAANGTGTRITPGQGTGQGTSALPEASAGGQARADEASNAVPGRTGNPPPSKRPQAPPGQTGAAGSGAGGGGSSGVERTQSGQSPAAPATGKPESSGKPAK